MTYHQIFEFLATGKDDTLVDFPPHVSTDDGGICEIACFEEAVT